MYKTLKKMFSLLMVLSLCLCLGFPVFAAPEETEPTEPEVRELHIETVKEFLDFAESCRIDSYSQDLLVHLDTDLDLSHESFQGIPIFCGTLEGNNHRITSLNLNTDGSYQGLFRYLTESALVKDLTVLGRVTPGGTQTCVGGIAGSNAGTIENCVFDGRLTAADSVGGIAGINTLTGTIVNCVTKGSISAEHYIGGITGDNMGILRSCTSHMEVNISSQDNTVQVTSITLDTLTGTEDPHTVTDVGGVAGTSSGVIRNCVNRGTVGYLHMGYNLGGIAGSSSGYITECKNYGSIYGRKEAGGIVGQFVPAARIEYSLDTLQILEQQLSGASSALNRASYNAQSNLGAVGEGIQILQEESLYAQDAVYQLLDGFHNGADPDEILAARNALSDSLYAMDSTMGYLGEAAYGTAGQLARDLRNVSGQISAMSQTLRHAKETTGATLTDVSDSDTPEELTGKVSLCQNYGSISGDINAGGIAGSIAFESETDPEDQVEISGRQSLNAEGELRAVILSCENKGPVTGKRLHVGGIVGFTTLGLVKDCINTGSIQGDSAQYVGGIAGSSAGYIRNCHVKAQLSGDSCVGGIAGTAGIATDCLSMVIIENAAERQGAILGILGENRDAQVTEPLKNNFYMSLSQDPGAIDGISYRGLAEPLAPTQFISLKDLPMAFQKATLTFRYEDGEEKALVIPVGSNLRHVQIPMLPQKDGFTGVWDGLSQYENSRIYFDVTFDPLYEASRITIRSPEIRETGRPVLLAEGLFPHTENIDLDTRTPPTLDGTAAREAWTLPEFSDVQDTVLHYTYPSDMDPEYTRLWVHSEADGWLEVPFSVKESCLVFSVRSGDDGFCVTAVPDYRSWVYVAAAVAVFVGVSLLLRRRRQKKYGHTPKKAKKRRNNQLS